MNLPFFLLFLIRTHSCASGFVNSADCIIIIHWFKFHFENVSLEIVSFFRDKIKG